VIVHVAFGDVASTIVVRFTLGLIVNAIDHSSALAFV
jgi:hypothetical protein